MDHRAVGQAESINAAGHDELRFVGGAISPEMETPKLLWLKQNRRDVFDAAWQFFDLTAFLPWKSSGSLARSSCKLARKTVVWGKGCSLRVDLGCRRIIKTKQQINI